MKIGLLSDTHNNLSNTLQCIDAFRKMSITTIIHCGDLTDCELIRYFDGLRLIYTYGNCDQATGMINAAVKQLGNASQAGTFFHGELDGKKIYATHGDLAGSIFERVQLRQYDYIFHGHTHRRADYRQLASRVINPGALGGVHIESRSYATLDLASDTLEYHQLDEQRG